MSIQWFPGHMVAAQKKAAETMEFTDVVIEVLDARIPGASQNPTLAILRLRIAFISVDFPTLGTHIIIIRSGLSVSPRWGANVLHSASIFFGSFTFLHEMATAFVWGILLKNCIH